MGLKARRAVGPCVSVRPSRVEELIRSLSIPTLSNQHNELDFIPFFQHFSFHAMKRPTNLFLLTFGSLVLAAKKNLIIDTDLFSDVEYVPPHPCFLYLAHRFSVMPARCSS